MFSPYNPCALTLLPGYLKISKSGSKPPCFQHSSTTLHRHHPPHPTPGKGSGRMAKRKFSKKEEEQVEIIEIDDSCPSPVSQKNGTPLRSIVCVRNREHIKNFEKTEECFILEFDPNDSFDISKISGSKNTESGDSPDLHVLAEKGQVACRDYPHSRHNCVKYSFEKTPHISYCELCYCYVCDVAAPCKKWDGALGHCHAFNNESWNNERIFKKRILKRLVDAITKMDDPPLQHDEL